MLPKTFFIIVHIFQCTFLSEWVGMFILGWRSDLVVMTEFTSHKHFILWILLECNTHNIYCPNTGFALHPHCDNVTLSQSGWGWGANPVLGQYMCYIHKK